MKMINHKKMQQTTPEFNNGFIKNYSNSSFELFKPQRPSVQPNNIQHQMSQKESNEYNYVY
jgi:hypothetical protein